MSDLFAFMAVFFAACVLYKWRRPILARLKRFDENNRARKRQEWDDRFDATAHYRHTLALAEENVEPVGEIRWRDERLGTPVVRYVFLSEHFATREEADAARKVHVIGRAREFYRELDELRLGRQARPNVMR